MNAAYQMLTQFKAIVTNTTFTPSEGTSFAQTKKTTDHDLGFNKAKWEDRVCSLCGKKGHPPYPEWCTVAKAFNENPSLWSEFKETYLSTSDSEASKPSKRTTSRKAFKDKDKQSKSKHSSKTSDNDTKKAIAHLMKARNNKPRPRRSKPNSLHSSSRGSPLPPPKMTAMVTIPPTRTTTLSSPWSNHLHATAGAPKIAGVQKITGALTAAPTHASMPQLDVRPHLHPMMMTTPTPRSLMLPIAPLTVIHLTLALVGLT
jgi:hypothetical protein